MTTISKKRAFTMIETLVCTALLAMLVWATVMITGVANYAVAESRDEFWRMNGYDIFVESYTNAVKNATNIQTKDGTILFVETAHDSHTFEFDHNRLYMDGTELFKASGGKFVTTGELVMLSMKPEGYGDVELTIYIDSADY